VARIQQQVLDALRQSPQSDPAVQDAIARLNSQLFDISMVSLFSWSAQHQPASMQMNRRFYLISSNKEFSNQFSVRFLINNLNKQRGSRSVILCRYRSNAK